MSTYRVGKTARPARLLNYLINVNTVRAAFVGLSAYVCGDRGSSGWTKNKSATSISPRKIGQSTVGPSRRANPSVCQHTHTRRPDDAFYTVHLI